MPNDNEQHNNGKEPARMVLSGASPIQVKFIGWLVLVCAGGFSAWVWWAASMSTKLDVVIANQAQQLAMVKEVASDMSRIKEWRIQIDTVGSPATVIRLDRIATELQELSKAFALHLATTTDMKTRQ